MADKASLSVAIVAILIAAGSIAYTNSIVGGIAGQVDQAKKDVSSSITSQVGQINSKLSPLDSSVNSVKQEQTAIRSLVDQRIGGLEKSLQDAQTRLAQAEKVAQQSQAELQQLKSDQALEEAAKKEQAPLIYGNIDAPDFSGVVWPRFRESYPWAPAQGKYIEGFTPLRVRFISEYNAGAPTADIVWQSVAPMLGEMIPYMQPFNEMKYKGLYEITVYPTKDNALSYVTHILPRIIIYNSNLLKDSEAPTGWLDLANPKWKGKLVMQDITRLETTTEVFADLLFAMKDRAKWEAWAKGIAANQPIFTGSNSEAYTKVLAGEFPVGFGLLNDIIVQKPGAPVKVAWPKDDLKGVPLGPSSALGISKKAANPNFAKLFATWLLSPAGQRALAETGRPPALTTIDHPNSVGKQIPAGIALLPPDQEFRKDPKPFGAIVSAFFK